MSGLLGPVTANPLMLAQSLKAREQPRKQLTGQGLLDTAAIGLSPVPVIGDALGLAADASRFYNEPESRTPLNFGLAALGMLPFVPSGVGAVKKMTQYEKAHEIAQKNAALPVERGGLGLPPNNTAMDRAKAMGFDVDVYHGSPDISKTTEFDASKVVDNVQYGGKFYSSTDPSYASKYTENSLRGDYAGMIPLKMKSGKRFDMSKPISADDAASIMESLGQSDRAKIIRDSGKPYRSGSELFYFGLGSSIPNTTKGDAIFRSGFDSIHGDPKMEIVGNAGKPHSVVADPSRLRSRFAAFDPFRRNENNLLANVAPFGLAGLLGLSLYDAKQGD